MRHVTIDPADERQCRIATHQIMSIIDQHQFPVDVGALAAAVATLMLQMAFTGGACNRHHAAKNLEAFVASVEHFMACSEIVEMRAQ